MKATELMIGDWVWYEHTNQYKTRVIDIRKFGEDNYAITCKRDESDPLYEKAPMGYMSVDILKPIPITEEMLVRNGFTGGLPYAILRLDEHSWLEYYYHEHRLRKWWHGVDEWMNHAVVKEVVFEVNCYYVHELQHCLRMLNIKKEIEL